MGVEGELKLDSLPPLFINGKEYSDLRNEFKNVWCEC
jgi:hypothetical protein